MNIKNITLIPVQTIGIYLDEIADMLLQNIEELTLYVIELKNENEKLIRKNSEQDKIIQQLIKDRNYD